MLIFKKAQLSFLNNIYEILFILTLASIFLPINAFASETPPTILVESNQWVFDRPIGYIQIAMENTDVFIKNFDTPKYRSVFDSGKWSQFFFDSQTRFAQFDQSSFWYNYSVGLLQKNGQLHDIANNFDLPLETTSILSVPFRLGAEWQWDRWRWVLPSLGFSIGFQQFRISSSMSGAEMLGGFAYQGPQLRFKFVTPISHLSISTSWSRKSFMSGDSQYFQTSNDFTLGAGWLY